MPPPFRAPRGAGLADIDQAIQTGAFTPIIGAACSCLDHDGEPRSNLASDIQRRAVELVTDLNIRDDQLSRDDLRYLHEIIDFGPQFGSPPHEQQLQVEQRNLLLALLRIDRLACLLFKTPAQLDQPSESLWRHRANHRIHFPRRPDDWQVPLNSLHAPAFAQSLADGIRAADAIVGSSDATTYDRLGLGAAGIRHQLHAIRAALFGDDNLPRRHAAITLTELLWFGHLLWHVFRFDLQYYPTSTELAFQLSLQAPELRYPPELPSLAQAAQALPDPVTPIAEWFCHYSDHQHLSAFYRTLAEWLARAFGVYRDAEDPDLLPPVLPTILTTNYDREIEKALEKHSRTYNVLIPVRHVRWARRESEAKRRKYAESTWLLKTVWSSHHSVPRGEGRKITWRFGGRVSSNLPQSDVQDIHPRDTVEKWEGPLVIKLHGSPLDILPSPESVPRLPASMTNLSDASLFEHRLVLSEADYLEDLRDDLPDQIKDILSTGNRTLVFLGQSISDWNVRVRLAHHVHWSSYPDYRHSNTLVQTRLAVNRNFRRFDTGFMGPLNIDIVDKDLALVRERIDKHMPQKR